MKHFLHPLLVAALIVASITVPTSVATAAGTPDVQLDREVSATTLYGSDVEVTLTAQQTTGPNAYNLSFTDIVPAGATLTNPSFPPTSAILLPDGSTKYIWNNVADLSTGAVVELTYSLSNYVADFNVDDSLAGTAEAFVNSAARTLVKFDTDGDVIDGSYTGNDSDSASTTLIPFTLDKSEDSAEAELLRGVHDHQTVYTLVITNNSEAITSGFTVVDYLPAGLEFLGCEAGDNSSADEYTGSGAIVDFPAGILAAECLNLTHTATTVLWDADGAGPLPEDVFTKVEWTLLGDLDPSDTLTIKYGAAIPLFENELAAGDATTNLDNNTGALTFDEQELTNYAAATGTYDGSEYTDETTKTVTAEDVVIRKAVASDAITHDAPSTWTLEFESSEYALSTGPITIVDTLPDGLDYIADGSATSVVPNATDGTVAVTWTADAFDSDSDSDVIDLSTTTLDEYRQGGPVSAGDSWTNTVDLETTATIITDNLGGTTDIDVVDASSAGQSATGIQIYKQVSEPADVDTDCGTGDGRTFSDNATGPFHLGDIVCYKLVVDFPSELNTIENVISDFLPAGFTFVSYEYTDDSTYAAGDPNVTVSAGPESPLLTWKIADAVASAHFEVVITTRITDVDAVTDGDITDNIMKTTHENTAGDVYQLRDQVGTVVEKPSVSLNKQITHLNTVELTDGPVDSLDVQAGDTVTYAVQVSNAGLQAANSVEVWDNLPSLLSCDDVDLVSISDAGTCDSSENRITWTIPLLAATGQAGSSVTLTYDVNLPDTLSPGDVFSNVAGVRDFEGTTNTGTPQPFFPEDNIDETVPEEDENTTPASDTADVQIVDPTVVKSVITGIDEDGNDADSEATIGELVTYTVTTTIPEGSTLYGAATITDVINSGLEIEGATYTINGVAAGVDDAPVAVSDQTVTITLADPYVVAVDAGDDVIELTIVTRVRDVNGPARSDLLSNAATLQWERADGSTNGTAETSNEVQTRIVEPDVGILKKSDADGTVTAGQTVEYTLEVRNNSADYTSTAHETTVIDYVPETLEPLNGADPAAPAASGDTLPGGGVWLDNGTERTITFTIDPLAPGAGEDLTYSARVVNPLVGGSEITNEAFVTTTSLTGSANTDERTSDSTAGDEGSGYQNESSLTLGAPEVAVAKTATPATRTIGQIINYSVDVTIPAQILAYDVTIVDSLPTGVRFGEFVESRCLENLAACSTAATLIGTPSDSDDTIGFYIGDIDPVADFERIVTITYTGVVTSDASDEDVLTNTVVPYWNDENDDTITEPPTAIPPVDGFVHTGTEADADVSIVEPKLAITKVVDSPDGVTDSRRAKPGEELDYTLVITNNGSSPAYDVVVTDTPNSGVTGFTSTPPEGVSNTNDDLTSGPFRWTIAGPIAVDGSVTITYSVTMPLFDESDEVVGAEVVNTADVPEYFGVPEVDRDPAADFVNYDNVTPDVVEVELDLASIGDYVWFDVDNDGNQDADEPPLALIAITVLYAGPDGDFDTADDNETYSTTTDDAGYYLVDELPGGEYRVTVDTDLASLGLTPSFDLDGTTLTPNGVWEGSLAENGAEDEVDFGYTGTGSIGDTVWFDQDLDDAKGVGEPGISGATVTVVFGGLDGDLTTTADNITYTTTTDATGAYSVENLPAGPYTVTVGGLPAGFIDVFDSDGGGDSTSETTLTAGQLRDDQDFGYAGTGSIGDFVWLDRNGDGEQDADEPGIFGATVELTWFGADGVAGGGDDAVFTTTTTADGLYTFPNLLPGNYSVAVTGGLPVGSENSFDLDENYDSVAAVTLGAAENIDTVDFGYNVTSVLGDRVWWDRNSDGLQTDNEPGLEGVEILVTYAGFDGIFGNEDDVEFPTETDSNGFWFVNDVPDGEYLVEVSGGVPAGFAPTFDQDSGTTNPDESSLLTLDGSDLNQDFGYVGDSSIADTVWLDFNKDGVKDAGEPGLSDVTVTLLWFGPDGVLGGDDDIELVEITDGSGEYYFGGLPAGSYSVTVDTTTLPAGVVATFDADAGSGQPTADTPASNVAANSTTAVVLPAATDLENIDFGYVGTGSIGDTIWLDQNGDGVVDSTEPGIAEVDVTLTWAGLDGLLGTDDDVVSVTKTDASGNYLFDDLPAGIFTVELSNLPAGVTATADPDAGSDDTSQLTLIGGEENLDQDFGYSGDAGVGDLVWLDVNNDGEQGTNEPGLVGVVVTVTSPGADGEFGTADDLIVATTTDENGNYLAEGLPAGDVTVSYDPATVTEGYVPSADLDGGVFSETSATLTAGETRLDVDFILIGSATLDGVVFDDVDGDGVRDAGDLGIPNATVTVVWAGPNGPVTITVVTDASGAWEITNLPAGTYTATVDLDSVDEGYRPSTGTSTTVELPAFGSRTIIQGLTTVMLAFTGSNIATGGLIAVLLMLGGLLVFLPTRRNGARGDKQEALTSGE